MDVVFMKASKRDNSTLQPSKTSTGAYTAPVEVFGPCDVTHPAFVIIGGPDTLQLSTYNFCFVQKWNRYYKITDWRWVDYRWVCSCEVDVLASYKQAIGNYTTYVLRSSKEFDGSIADSEYPMTCKMDVYADAMEDSSIWTTRYGCYSMTILGEGSSTTYVMGKNEFMALLFWAFSDAYINDLVGTEWEATNPELRLTANPTQYIQTVTYLPLEFKPEDGVNVGNVRIGRAEYIVPPGQNIYAVPLQRTWSKVVEIPFKAHPQESRGIYLNRAPYSSYTLDYPGFGVLSLPADLVANGLRIRAMVYVDYVTGGAKLELTTADPPSYVDMQTFAVYNSQIGVPISVSNIAAAGGLGAAATVGALAGFVTKAATGDIAGAVSGGLSAITSHTAATIPSVSAVGSQGGSTAISGGPFPRQTSNHYLIVDEDREHLGRPLCKVRKLSTIPGYIMVKNGDVPITGYMEEQERVKNYLEGGFYYE